MERWLRSLRAELADRMVIWSTPHLPGLLREYEAFYNEHRPHRALGTGHWAPGTGHWARPPHSDRCRTT